MKNIIILEKTKKKEKLSKDPTDTIAQAKMAQALRPINLTQRYKWAMSKADIETAKKLGLTEVKNHRKYTAKLRWNSISFMTRFQHWQHL